MRHWVKQPGTAVPRLFVAIRLPDPLKVTVRALQSGLANARWLKADSLHLTLAFIGEVEDATQHRIEAALSTVTAPLLNMETARARALPPARGAPRALDCRHAGRRTRFTGRCCQARSHRRGPDSRSAANSCPMSRSPGFAGSRPPRNSGVSSPLPQACVPLRAASQRSICFPASCSHREPNTRSKNLFHYRMRPVKIVSWSKPFEQHSATKGTIQLPSKTPTPPVHVAYDDEPASEPHNYLTTASIQ